MTLKTLLTPFRHRPFLMFSFLITFLVFFNPVFGAGPLAASLLYVIVFFPLEIIMVSISPYMTYKGMFNGDNDHQW